MTDSRPARSATPTAHRATKDDAAISRMSGALRHGQRHRPLPAPADERELLLVAVGLDVVDGGLVALHGDLLDLAVGDLIVLAEEALGLEEHFAVQRRELLARQAQRLLLLGLLGG